MPQNESLASSERSSSRRFNSDKIRQVESLSFDNLVVQFNDSIVQISVADKLLFKEICSPEAMIRRHLVRNSDKVYFAESLGNTHKIMQLTVQSGNEITKKEVYQLNGSKLVAFQFAHCSDEFPGHEFRLDDKQNMFILDD